MAQVDLKQTAVGSIVTPASGYNSLFVDASGQLWTLNSSGGQSTPTDTLAVLTATSSPSALAIVLASPSIPANSMKVGTSYRIAGRGNRVTSGTQTLILRAKIGTAGTTADGDVVVLPTVAFTAVANQAFEFDFLLTCRTAGSSGSVTGTGGVKIIGANNTAIASTAPIAQGIIGLGTALTVNTTVANFVSISATPSANTVDIYNCIIEQVA